MHTIHQGYTCKKFLWLQGKGFPSFTSTTTFPVNRKCKNKTKQNTTRLNDYSKSQKQSLLFLNVLFKPEPNPMETCRATARGWRLPFPLRTGTWMHRAMLPPKKFTLELSKFLRVVQTTSAACVGCSLRWTFPGVRWEMILVCSAQPAGSWCPCTATPGSIACAGSSQLRPQGPTVPGDSSG